MKTNYQVTIGYKAVIQINTYADNEIEAKEIALEAFKKRKDKIVNSFTEISDDYFKVDGCVDMDATWNMVQN